MFVYTVSHTVKQSFVYYSDREIKLLNLNGEGHVLRYVSPKKSQNLEPGKSGLKCPSAVPLIYILGGRLKQSYERGAKVVLVVKGAEKYKNLRTMVVRTVGKVRRQPKLHN